MFQFINFQNNKIFNKPLAPAIVKGHLFVKAIYRNLSDW